MSFQKCPICNGSGKISDILSGRTYRICDTCGGKKIINEWTGQPPKNNSDTDINSGINGNMESQNDYFGK